ncbi:MAG: ATP-binding protein [Mollicutes bacterium]|nr:ATP-binding protein [Mollicutes bacterium]
MFGKITYINDNYARIKILEGTIEATELMNLHVMFEDDKKKILGEVEDVDGDVIKVEFLGEVINDELIPGTIRKPSLSAQIRVITRDEVGLLIGKNDNNSFLLGVSPLYDDYPIMVNINDFFSNHTAIFGNSGSGKSWGVARLLQNVLANSKLTPVRSNFFIFDTYGEYYNAFKDIKKINPHFNFKVYTTSLYNNEGEQLRIPLWLLDVDDIAILLTATEHSQLPIIERMLKIVAIFAEDSEMAIKYKNHLIAKAIMTILYTNQTSASKRNDIFTILASCSTPQFNLEAPVKGVGYTRKFRECFTIDTAGNFMENILVTNYVASFIDEELEKYEAKKTNFYTLEQLEDALEFTLISEGLLRNEKLYNEAITLKVRLHSIVIGKYAQFFKMDKYVSLEAYVASLVSMNGNTAKAQIINFNLEDIDDWFAKFVTKIFTKIFFEFTRRLKMRASIPFHIFLEEAHRYVQNDRDNYLIGYNIFERVAKEGRKYGLLLSLISQRPVDISDTVISQCSNFLIFKITHPRDLEYIRKMIPNISIEIVEKQKSLQPGTCVAFGKAFKVPMIVKMQKPDPAPSSENSDVVNRWALY